MKDQKFNYEGLLYLLAFSFGLFIRLYRLGNLPLSEHEASLALQALGRFSGASLNHGPQNGTILLTGILFSLFGSANFWARLTSALAGSLLVAAPILFRKIVGPFAAVILAFGLAFDPSLIALSRNVDSGALAVSSLVFFIGFLINKKHAAAGIALGVAILGGIEFWHGIVIMIISVGLMAVLPRYMKNQPWAVSPQIISPLIGEFFVSFLLTTVLLGSLFFTRPVGLGGILSNLGLYLGGWLKSSTGIHIAQMVLLFLSCELLPLIFGLVGFFWIMKLKPGTARGLPVIFLTSVILSLLYPSREGIYLAWSVLPLWVLAAIGIQKFLVRMTDQTRVVYIFAGLICILLLFVVLNIVGLSSDEPASVDFQMRLAIIAGAIIVLGLLETLLVWGWSPGLGLTSIFLALFGVLFLNNLSAGWRSAGLGANPHAELWFSGSDLLDADLLTITVRQISDFNTGDPLESKIAVIEPVSNSIKWVLRDQIGVEFLTVIDDMAAPDMVITRDSYLPNLSSSYTGQDLYEVNPPHIDLDKPMTWLKWVLFRKIDQEKTPFFLWVRSDIFPGNSVGNDKQE